LFTNRRLALNIGKDEREDVVEEVRVGSELNWGGIKEKSVTGKKERQNFLRFLFSNVRGNQTKKFRVPIAGPIQLRSLLNPA
jgi:hypothetical protein